MTPFTVNISESKLAGLRERLRATIWPEDFGNDAWRYGVARPWLEGMIRYWSEEFNWRAQEAAINTVPNYRTEIDGIVIHFLHIKGKGPNPTPIILTHGWPWTFWDWKDTLARLTDPQSFGGDASDAFDVVVPSLPGYGFSAPLRTTGIDVRRIGGLWAKLMTETLGYSRFAAAGGDWGSVITAELGHAYPDRVIGVHMTLPLLPGMDRGVPEGEFAEDERWMFSRLEESLPLVASHMTVQRYEPQTLAYALTDSPSGLGGMDLDPQTQLERLRR